MTNLKTQLETAQRELAELQEDLPRFHGLLTDNEREAERLRREKADLDVQAKAKGRVSVAREMLEQHQSDIAGAQAEVSRIEASIERENTILEMVQHSKAAAAERARLDRAFDRLIVEVQRAASTLTEAWQAENAARRAFVDTGAELLPVLRGYTPLSSAEREAADLLLEELQEHGAALEAVRDGATGSFSAWDKSPVKELPRDKVSVLLWDAIRLLTERNKDAHNLRRLTPTKPRTVAVLETGSRI